MALVFLVLAAGASVKALALANMAASQGVGGVQRRTPAAAIARKNAGAGPRASPKAAHR